jgi:hypothetical protein
MLAVKTSNVLFIDKTGQEKMLGSGFGALAQLE